MHWINTVTEESIYGEVSRLQIRKYLPSVYVQYFKNSFDNGSFLPHVEY